MVENFPPRAMADDVARIYLGIVAATAGHSTAVVEAALAMALTLVGERHGLSGDALVDWIDTIATAASIAAQRATLDLQVLPSAIAPRESLN